MNRRVSLGAGVVMAAAQLLLTGCGSTTPTSPSETVLLNTNLNFVAGLNCNNGGVSADFAGTAGKTVVITATGAAALTPRFTLYAPDFTTQLGGSVAGAAGSSSLTSTLTLTGTHHVTACDLGGVAGTIVLKVTQK